MARKRIKAGERIEPGTYLTEIRDGKVDTIARAETDVIREAKRKGGRTKYDGTIETLLDLPGRPHRDGFRGSWSLASGYLCESSREDLEILKAYFETELEKVTEALKGML